MVSKFCPGEMVHRQSNDGNWSSEKFRIHSVEYSHAHAHYHYQFDDSIGEIYRDFELSYTPMKNNFNRVLDAFRALPINQQQDFILELFKLNG